MSKVPRAVVELHSGPAARICGVKMEDGSCPATDFLTDLDDRAKAKFKARFTLLGETGDLRTPDFKNKVSNEGKPTVFEIKVDHGPGYRLYVIRHGGDWYATHGGKKPKKREVAKEVERARELYAQGGDDE